jgi:UDP-N-acetylglucosamine transferase subunit ALG13
MKKILAVASIGGHWKQLLRIAKPLEGRFDMVYASTHPKCATMTGAGKFYSIPDFSRSNAWRLIPAFFRFFRILLKERPDAVLTTGAAPGLVCVLAGWMLRRKTIWVDSIANAERMSASGRIARCLASRVYTQWPDLAQKGVTYSGTVWGEAPETPEAPQPPKGGDKGGGLIFVTTGTQLPFDRLIHILDEVAPQLNADVVAQVHSSSYSAQHLRTVDFLPPDEFDRLFCKARLIVAHAGMGTILSALQQEKPIIIFPRIAALGEHRNEHQLATAEKMRERGWVYVATTEEQLKQLLLTPDLHPLYRIGATASGQLIQSVTDFIEK